MTFKIGKKLVGKGQPVFVVAELSANHNQKFDLALKTIEAAKKAGADAIKLQTYTPDTITINVKSRLFTINDGSVWHGRNLYELYGQAYTPWQWQPKLKKYAEKLGLICFCSPFDKTAVDFLAKMAVPAYKVASYEITDIPLIEYMASKGKPMIISTGVATKKDILQAIDACRRMGNRQIAILKCTSGYPSPLQEINLRTIPDIEKRFKVIIGLSDHTMGQTVAVAACALGAKIVEKHFILSRSLGGPDCHFSMEPAEFRQMVDEIRDLEKALGKVTYKLTPESKKARWNTRSLFAVEDIKKGERLTAKNVRSIRPGFGLHPKYLLNVLGKTARNDIKKGSPLKWHDISKLSNPAESLY